MIRGPPGENVALPRMGTFLAGGTLAQAQKNTTLLIIFILF
jgi:hypothetical protein